MSSFVYMPLSGPEHLRILHLLPGDGPITTHLTHVSLSDRSTYEALSYTWGNPSDTVKLSCGESIIQVTTKLHTALQGLRSPDRIRPLWIDAVCINQADPDEKAQQIPLMREIYANASGVVVWLGEADHLTGKALHHAITLAREHDTQEQKTAGKIDPVKEGENALLSLLGRPWFRRIWVIQEVAVASAEAVTVHCGQYQIPWNILSSAATKVEQNKRTVYHSLFQHVKEATTTKNELRLPLLSLATQYRSCQASRPSDKLYALTGLADPKSIQCLSIDYRKSHQDVYREWTLQCIKESGSLDVLGCAELSDAPGLADEPSWVPDWSALRTSCNLSHAQLFGKWTPEYRAAAEARHCFNIPTAVKILPCKGHEVGRISRCSSVYLDKEVPRLGPSRRWLEVWYGGLQRQLDWEGVSGVRTERFYPTGESIDSVYWRTLCAGCLPEHEETIEQEFRDFDRQMKTLSILHTLHLSSSRTLLFVLITGFFIRRYFLHWLPSIGLSNIPKEVNRWPFQNRMVFAQGRVLAVTADGLLGLVPHTAREGDRVWILEGGRVPFVLRKSDAGDHWQVVGEAYIHGMMQGERYRAEDCGDIYLS